MLQIILAVLLYKYLVQDILDMELLEEEEIVLQDMRLAVAVVLL